MASSGLPSGAFLTTIEGRRCTAIPRVAAASAGPSSVITTSVAPVTTTTSSVRAATTRPTTEVAAAPVAEIDTVAEQSSASTTTSSLVPTASTSLLSVQIAQAQASVSGPPASPTTPLPAALLPTTRATPQSFTAFADGASSQASVPQTSQADGSVTAPAADPPAVSSEPPAAETSAPDLRQGPAATPLLTTIDSPQTRTATPVPEATGTTSADPGLAAIPNLNSNAVQSTVAVAGGVIGGVVAISVLAFFIWWWRRRLLRKRRSTLLTPLDLVPSYDRDEKGGYVITRGSIGPTPVTEKVKAALGQNFRKLRGHIRNRTAPSVNLDRGTSQFIDPAGARSRSNSGIIGAEPTAKDRLRGWWSGLGKKRNQVSEEKNAAVAQPKKAASSSQPDFLTLLNMDNPELDREAQRRRASIARANGSASSTDNFLSGINLNFSNDDPFSDANAIAHISAKPAPLAVGSGNPSNPFSDTNAIPDPLPHNMPKPATYVADIRRSRSNSMARRQPSTVYNRDSTDSLGSLATATTANQRNKFRSDPFDLERPELLGRANLPPSSINNNNNTTTTAADRNPNQPDTDPLTLTRPPTRARTRADSFSSRYSKFSKYSSGISVLSAVESMGEWSDPGPDVGPAASRTQAQTQAQGQGQGQGWTVPDGNGVSVAGWRERLVREREQGQEGGSSWGGEGRSGNRRMSGGSLGSVGKAM